VEILQRGKRMDYIYKKFAYNCKCGYSINVFIDFGTPQETYKCRKCGTSVKREQIV
jgi:predicted SprT family Zn-dependent metalloprotease